MKFPHSYLYKHIDSPSVNFSIISAKSLDKITKTYRQMKYHRDKHIISLNICNNL